MKHRQQPSRTGKGGNSQHIEVDKLVRQKINSKTLQQIASSGMTRVYKLASLLSVKTALLSVQHHRRCQRGIHETRCKAKVFWCMNWAHGHSDILPQPPVTRPSAQSPPAIRRKGHCGGIEASVTGFPYQTGDLPDTHILAAMGTGSSDVEAEIPHALLVRLNQILTILRTVVDDAISTTHQAQRQTQHLLYLYVYSLLDTNTENRWFTNHC